MGRINFTKDVLNRFISESAGRLKMSVASYLENRASKSYLILNGARPLTIDENTADICVFDNKEMALEEAAEYENAKVVKEYDYYVSKGIFSNVA